MTKALAFFMNREMVAAWGKWQGLTLVRFSAQPEPFRTQNTP